METTTHPTFDTPRLDLYAPIHKALRNFMADTLLRVGRLDVFDGGEMARTLGQLDALLLQCEQHLGHETDFVHTALEARAPGSAARVAAEHAEHLAAIAELREGACQLRAASPPQRMPLSLQLYRHLALFVQQLDGDVLSEVIERHQRVALEVVRQVGPRLELGVVGDAAFQGDWLVLPERRGHA